MLEVSSNHFNHAHTNGNANMYVHQPEESISYATTERVDSDQNFPKDSRSTGDLGGAEGSSCHNAEQNCDRLARRRFRDIDSIPLFVSTPSNEDTASGENSSFEYLQKKVRRISRMYQDHSVDPFEALEVEPPLLDYLVRHGALTQEASETILCAKKTKQRTLLLTHLGLTLTNETTGRPVGSGTPPSASLTTGFALLLNALRHTGHHSLASHLDCGRRIRPSPGLQCSDTFELGTLSSNQRRRGQLCLQIRLDAIKVDPAVYDHLIQPCPSFSTERRDSNSSRSCDLRGTPLAKSKPFTPMLPSFVEDLSTDSGPRTNELPNPPWPAPRAPFWIDQNEPARVAVEVTEHQHHPNIVPNEPSVNTTPEKSVGCFRKLFCLFRPFRKHKPKKSKDSITLETIPIPAPRVHDENDAAVTRFRHAIVPTNGAGDGPTPIPQIDRLAAAKLALLDTKSSEFCQAVLNSSLPLYDAIVKYFEQSSGVLVLDCTIDPSSCITPASLADVSPGTALCVTVVATRPDLVTRLADACQSENNQSSNRSQVPKSEPFDGSRLSTDLQKVLKEVNITSVLCVQDFRLSVSLNSSEVSKALEELADLIE